MRICRELRQRGENIAQPLVRIAEKRNLRTSAGEGESLHAKASRDAEIVGPAFEAGEEVGVRGVRGGDDCAIGENDLDIRRGKCQ